MSNDFLPIHVSVAALCHVQSGFNKWRGSCYLLWIKIAILTVTSLFRLWLFERRIALTRVNPGIFDGGRVGGRVQTCLKVLNVLPTVKISTLPCCSCSLLRLLLITYFTVPNIVCDPSVIPISVSKCLVNC